MSSPQAELAQLSQAVQDATAVNYATVAALTWLLFDILLTSGDEVKLMWRSRFTLQKLLYYIMRYYTLASLAFFFVVESSQTVKNNLNFCKFYFWFDAFNIGLLPTMVGEALMAMRIYAFYRQRRAILIVVVTLYVAEVAAEIWAIITTRLDLQVTQLPSIVPIPGCSSTRPGMNPIIVAGSVPLFVATVFFLLMLFKQLGNMGLIGGKGHALSLQESRKIAPTLYVFFRDGTGYFLMVMVVESSVIFFTVHFGDRELANMYEPWALATYAIASTRMVLGLRGSVTTDTSQLRSDDTEMLPLNRSG